MALLRATSNGAVQSRQIANLFPFIDKREDVSKIIDFLSNGASQISAKSTWADEGGSKLNGVSAAALLGGHDIVSKKYVELMLALKKCGNCDEGYAWNAGSYSHQCDTCAKTTGDGYRCAGGGHYVCGKCVRKHMRGGGGGIVDDDDDDAPPKRLYSRDVCLLVLNECNAQSGGSNGDMKKLMMVQGMAMQKNGVDDGDDFQKSCKIHREVAGDAEFPVELLKQLALPPAVGTHGAKLRPGTQLFLQLVHVAGERKLYLYGDGGVPRAALAVLVRDLLQLDHECVYKT